MSGNKANGNNSPNLTPYVCGAVISIATIKINFVAGIIATGVCAFITFPSLTAATILNEGTSSGDNGNFDTLETSSCLIDSFAVCNTYNSFDTFN